MQTDFPEQDQITADQMFETGIAHLHTEWTKDGVFQVTIRSPAVQGLREYYRYISDEAGQRAFSGPVRIWRTVERRKMVSLYSGPKEARVKL